jgi:hypothetical protein
MQDQYILYLLITHYKKKKKITVLNPFFLKIKNKKITVLRLKKGSMKTFGAVLKMAQPIGY